MDVFERVAVVHHEGVRSTLHWDGADGAILVGEFMGMETTVEKTREEAQRDYLQWQELLERGELEVDFVDHEVVDRLMEGVEGWQPRKR